MGGPGKFLFKILLLARKEITIKVLEILGDFDFALLSFLLTQEISVEVQKCLSGAIKSQQFKATPESAESFSPVILLSQHQSRQSSFLHWGLKDFDFQKEDEEDDFEGVKCGESGFCSALAPRNNLITKRCVEWYLI